MQLKEWADVATVITAVATIATVIIGFFTIIAAFNGIKSAIEQTRLQLNAMHLENRKWNTLNICAQYELNDVISSAARNIFVLSKNPNKNPDDYSKCCRDAMIVLSYLDGIAIGVGQGLYEEDLARDHLHQIVKSQIDNLLSPDAASRFGLDKNDYAFLTAMVDSDAKCNPVDSIGSSTKSRVSHSERRPSARFPGDEDGSARKNIEPLQ